MVGGERGMEYFDIFRRHEVLNAGVNKGDGIVTGSQIDAAHTGGSQPFKLHLQQETGIVALTLGQIGKQGVKIGLIKQG